MTDLLLLSGARLKASVIPLSHGMPRTDDLRVIAARFIFYLS